MDKMQETRLLSSLERIADTLDRIEQALLLPFLAREPESRNDRDDD